MVQKPGFGPENKSSRRYSRSISLIQKLVFTKMMVKLEWIKVRKVTVEVPGSCSQKDKEAT